MKYLSLFTPFCRDEISSGDELIPAKKTGMKFHPGIKKGKKRCETHNPRIEFYNGHVFTRFLTHILNILFNFNMLNIMNVRRKTL